MAFVKDVLDFGRRIRSMKAGQRVCLTHSHADQPDHRTRSHLRTYVAIFIGFIKCIKPSIRSHGIRLARLHNVSPVGVIVYSCIAWTIKPSD